MLITSHIGNERIGHIKFIVYEDNSITSASTHVDVDHRGKGLATKMYSFAHSLGYKIRPSPLQTAEGQSMWKHFRKTKQPFAKETFFEKLRRICSII